MPKENQKQKKPGEKTRESDNVQQEGFCLTRRTFLRTSVLAATAVFIQRR